MLIKLVNTYLVTSTARLIACPYKPYCLKVVFPGILCNTFSKNILKYIPVDMYSAFMVYNIVRISPRVGGEPYSFRYCSLFCCGPDLKSWSKKNGALFSFNENMESRKGIMF